METRVVSVSPGWRMEHCLFKAASFTDIGIVVQGSRITV
jgi:hypothetical protein